MLRFNENNEVIQEQEYRAVLVGLELNKDISYSMQERAEYRVDGERMADFINVGFGNMVNGDKIISMVSTDAAPIKRMIQNARDEGKAVDATCGRRTRAVLVMESGHLILSALTTDTLSSRCHSKRNDEDEENER